MVCFFYRPEAYKIIEYENGDSTIGVAEIIVAKNNGDLGTAKLGYQGEKQRFNNLPEDKSNGNKELLIKELLNAEN